MENNKRATLKNATRPQSLMDNKLQLGVIGSWRNELPEHSYAIAQQVGEKIAKAGHYLFTGGSTGIMEFAMKGCKEAGGTTIGIIPSADYRTYPHLGKYIDIKINTGMAENGRIPILANCCDGVIAIGGGVGTLTEVASSYHQGKPVVIIEGTGHVADKVKKLLDEDGYLDAKRLVKIEFATTAKEAVEKLITAITNHEGRPDNVFGPEHGKRA